MAQNNKPGEQYQQFQNDTPVNDYGQTQSYSQPQQYTQPYMNQPQVVVQPNSSIQTFTVESATEPWTWCPLVTSMISFFCCTIFGFIATVMAILSYVDYKGKEYERHRAKRSCAYGFGIAGIVIGVVIAIIVIIAVSLTTAAAVNAVEQGENNYNFGN